MGSWFSKKKNDDKSNNKDFQPGNNEKGKCSLIKEAPTFSNQQINSFFKNFVINFLINILEISTQNNQKQWWDEKKISREKIIQSLIDSDINYNQFFNDTGKSFKKIYAKSECNSKFTAGDIRKINQFVSEQKIKEALKIIKEKYPQKYQELATDFLLNFMSFVNINRFRLINAGLKEEYFEDIYQDYDKAIAVKKNRLTKFVPKLPPNLREKGRIKTLNEINFLKKQKDNRDNTLNLAIKQLLSKEYQIIEPSAKNNSTAKPNITVPIPNKNSNSGSKTRMNNNS